MGELRQCFYTYMVHLSLNPGFNKNVTMLQWAYNQSFRALRPRFGPFSL